MADPLFPIQVLTPERVLLDGEARAVVLRSSDGDLTVLDGHTPLITDVVPGEVRIDQEQGSVRLAVHGGYLQVEKGPAGSDDSERRSGAGTRVTVLAGVAELADQIDVARAERARDEASARLEELRSAGRGSSGGASSSGGEPGEGAPATDVEVAEAEAALRRAEVRLQVAAGPAN
ncbi:MAG TPA: F0F1 ATP synthase subunit epsilon [Acidimicrobiales bacterium]|nr:F0F1 ATP synthase subunit epsilon [Acidimicrobiales bacterium]